MRRCMLLINNKPFQHKEPPRPWLQLDCLTTVKPHPFLSLNASAVAGCQDCKDAVTIFRTVRAHFALCK